jgi:hypothetical protein
VSKIIYYSIVRIKYVQSNRSKGTREVWVVCSYNTAAEINKHKSKWIADYYWNKSKKKPLVIVTEVISSKPIGTKV